MKYTNKELLADVRYVARAISTNVEDPRDIVHHLFVTDNHTLLGTDGARLHFSSRPHEILEPGAYKVMTMRRAYVELEKIDLPDWGKNIKQILRVMRPGSKDAAPKHIDFSCEDLTEGDTIDPFKRPKNLGKPGEKLGAFAILPLLTSKFIMRIGQDYEGDLLYNSKFVSEAICNGVTDVWREGGNIGKAIVEGGHYKAIIMPARV